MAGAERGWYQRSLLLSLRNWLQHLSPPLLHEATDELRNLMRCGIEREMPRTEALMTRRSRTRPIFRSLNLGTAFSSRGQICQSYIRSCGFNRIHIDVDQVDHDMHCQWILAMVPINNGHLSRRSQNESLATFLASLRSPNSYLRILKPSRFRNLQSRLFHEYTTVKFVKILFTQ